MKNQIEQMEKQLSQIVNQFRIIGEVVQIKRLGDGFINDTFIVETKNPGQCDYLLQRKNKNVFRDVPGMMGNILKVTTYLKQKIQEKGGDPERETLTLIKTKSGDLYTIDADGEYWTVCILIKDHVLFEKADTPELAKSGGKGIGMFQAMLADFSEPLVDTLPGFHDMRFRFNQWDDVLSRDPVGRKQDLEQEIAWIENRRAEMLEFWQLVEEGKIPKRITHNDTKISNILFDSDHEVLCVIDLDTVLSSIVLNDFGDAIRSYANTGLEDDPVLSGVGLNMEIFEAFSQGYLSMAKPFLTEIEIEYLAFSARFITYEQTLRFLMDYIDGDNYYRINYPDHNLVRTRAQYKLLQSIEDNYPKMYNLIKESSK